MEWIVGLVVLIVLTIAWRFWQARESFRANFGNIRIDAVELNITRTQQAPQLSWDVGDTAADNRFTVMMTDPLQGSSEYLHWLVINVPGNLISAGALIIPYQGPTPPVGDPPHQYDIRVYRQKRLIDPENVRIDSRNGFNRKQFEKTFDLNNVGETFFKTRR